MLPHDTKSPKKALWLCCQVVTADHISGQENCNHGPVVPLTSMQATSTPTDSTLISSGGQSGRELAATSRLSKLHPSFPPITSGNCSFILYCFPAAITTLTFTHNLLSFSLSFWECTHQIPALWGAASLPRDWLWKLRKSGRGERDNTRKTENSMPTFKSFLLPPPINSVTWFILPEEQPPGFTWIAGGFLMSTNN